MKAKTCVSDASVIIPWLHTGVEPNAEDSLRLKRDFMAGRIRISVPRLLFLEVTNWYVHAKRKHPSNAPDLGILFRMDFNIYDPAQESHPDIAQLAFENGLTAYDALYMHMALELGSPLWTADEALARAWGKRPGGHIRHYRSR